MKEMLSKTQNQLIIEQRYRQTNIKLIGMCINRSALFTSKDDSMTSRGLHHCDLLQNVLISTSNQTCTFKLITNLCFDIKSISWNVKLVIMFDHVYHLLFYTKLLLACMLHNDARWSLQISHYFKIYFFN